MSRSACSTHVGFIYLHIHQAGLSYGLRAISGQWRHDKRLYSLHSGQWGNELVLVCARPALCCAGHNPTTCSGWPEAALRYIASIVQTAFRPSVTVAPGKYGSPLPISIRSNCM